MKTAFMSSVARLICVTVGLAAAASAHADPSEFKGYTAINQMLRDRIMSPTASFSLSDYFGDYDLLQLLGTYQGAGFTGRYRNGDPNVVNTLLWYIALSGVAGDLGAICSPRPDAPLAKKLGAEFGLALAALCLEMPVREGVALKTTPAWTEDALYAYWSLLIGFDAPQEEFVAWKGFALSRRQADAPPPAALTEITTAIFLNPYFLLR